MMGEEKVESGTGAAEPNRKNDNRRTGILPNAGGIRQTGTLSNEGRRIRQTGTLPNVDRTRQTGTLPNVGRTRQTGTLPDVNRQQEAESSQRPKRNIVGDEHIYRIPRGTVLNGNKAKLVVDKGIWNSEYVEMYLVRDTKSAYVAKVYYEWTTENKYQDEIIKFLENNKQPGIIPLLDRGLYEDRDYYIFPYYEKRSMDEYKPELNSVRLARFVKVLNEALRSIHSAGFLHADIKPANILYDEKRDIPVITDFGSMTTLKQDIQMKVQRSITSAKGKVSEGYLAPYALEYGAAKGERVLDLGIKTDYFALGVSLCEMFVRKPFYKMFRSNAEIASSLRANSVHYHRDVEQNERLYNLVQALLSNSPDLCPGYKEVNDWLNGSTLKVVHRVEAKAGFNYYFKRKFYTDPKELAEAFVGEHWENCINDLFRKQELYDVYKEYDKKVYSEIIDIREDNRSEETKAASAFRIVCWMYPEIRFFWDGKYYNHENPKKADRELAMDICKSVEAGDHKFDTLFSTGALRTYFDVDEGRQQFLKDIERILVISGYAMERAQLIFAEMVSPGILTGILSGDKILDFEDYLKAVNSSVLQGGFDQAVEYNLGNRANKNKLVILQEKAYGSEIINAILCCNGHEEELIQQKEKTDKVFQPLIRLLLMMGKILGYKNVLSGVHKSAAYQAIAKYVKISDQFDYIDTDPNRYYEAEPIGEEFKRYREMFTEMEKGSSVELSVYLNLMDDVLETIRRIRDDKDGCAPVVYGNIFNESGLLIARSSYIRPHNSGGAMCMVNEKYPMPKAVAQHLLTKGFEIKIEELEEQRRLFQDSLQMTKQMADSFFSNFKIATGTEDVTGEYLQPQWKYILHILFPVLALLACAWLLRCGYVFWHNHEHDLKLAEGKYMAAIVGISVVIALPGIVSGFQRLKNAVINYRNYRCNKNLMRRYAAQKKLQKELERFSRIGNIGSLSSESKKEIQDIAGLSGLDAYMDKYGIEQGYADISPLTLRSSVLGIVCCVAVIAFISLPVSKMTDGLVKNDFLAAQQAADTKVKNSILGTINQLYSASILKLMEKTNTDWLVGQYNDGELTQEEYIRQTGQYMDLFALNHGKMSKKNSDVLKKMPLSKQAFAKGNEYYDSQKLEKAAVQYCKVIEADSDYEKAQERMEEYFKSLFQKQQKYIDKGNEEGIKKIEKKYKNFIDYGAKDDDLQNCYDCLQNYSGDERFLRMIAYQLKRNAKSWKDVAKIGCKKISDGQYYVKKETVPKKDWLFGKKYIHCSCVNYKTYMWERLDDFEQECNMVEYDKKWTEDDFYNFLLQNAKE